MDDSISGARAAPASPSVPPVPPAEVPPAVPPTPPDPPNVPARPTVVAASVTAVVPNLAIQEELAALRTELRLATAMFRGVSAAATTPAASSDAR